MRIQSVLLSLFLIAGVGLVIVPDPVANAAHKLQMRFESHGNGQRTVIATAPNGNSVVVASGAVTEVKDLHRVAELCGTSYEAHGICVRGPKNADLKCTTKGWSRKHGKRTTFHFSNGDHIHVHEDGLVDHDD